MYFAMDTPERLSTTFRFALGLSRSGNRNPAHTARFQGFYTVGTPRVRVQDVHGPGTQIVCVMSTAAQCHDGRRQVRPRALFWNLGCFIHHNNENYYRVRLSTMTAPSVSPDTARAEEQSRWWGSESEIGGSEYLVVAGECAVAGSSDVKSCRGTPLVYAHGL